MLIISFHFIYLSNLFVICSLHAMLSVMFFLLLGYSMFLLYCVITVLAGGATPQFEYHIEYLLQTLHPSSSLFPASTDFQHLC